MEVKKCIVCGDEFRSDEHDTCSKLCERALQRARLAETLRRYQKMMYLEMLDRGPRLEQIKRIASGRR